MHLKDDDLLGTLGAILYIVERDHKPGTNNHELLKNTKEKLNYLQENYKLVEKK